MNVINLRSLTLDDLPLTLKWHNQSEIVDWYSGHPFPVNYEMEKKWYENILTSNIPLTVFGIEHATDQKLIGITVLKDINLINRVAEYAIYIGEKEYRGKGLSKVATLETLSFAFNKLGLNRIILKVLDNNKVAIKLYENVGFKKEGKLRESIFKNNSFYNELIFGILKIEFDGRI